MAGKWLKRKLFILWLAIAATRIALQFWDSLGIMNSLALNIAYAVFILGIIGSEISILVGASQLFSKVAEAAKTTIVFDSASKFAWRLRNLGFLT